MIKTFRPYVRPARAMLATGLLASVAVAVMEWAAPWPLKFIFDSVLGHRPLPGWLGWLPAKRASLLVALAGAMVVVAAGRAVADYLSNRLVATAGQRSCSTSVASCSATSRDRRCRSTSAGGRATCWPAWAATSKPSKARW